MNSTQILLLLIGVFLIINAGNILQVFQGKATINVAKGSRTTTTVLQQSPAAAAATGTVAKGQAGT